MAGKAKLAADRKVYLRECGELGEKVVAINRVAKVVKGGRRFSFSALAVVGDQRGNVGYGLGKANEVPNAIKKAGDAARKNIIRVPLHGTTIPFEVTGRCGSTRVLLKPASPGTGVIAGSSVRNVMELVGVHDVLSKVFYSRNVHNVLGAVFDALLQLEAPEQVAARRQRALDSLGYQAYGA